MIPAILGAVAVVIFVLWQVIKNSNTTLEEMPTMQQPTNFYDKVDVISANLGIDPGWLLACMDFESGLNPQRVNSVSGATGLIQFLPDTANNLGTSTEDLANMDAVTQMDYVYKYFYPYTRRMSNLGDVYMVILWPVAVGKLDSYVLFKQGSNEYTQNAGLDSGGKGFVTRGDAVARVQRIYASKYTQESSRNA